MEEQKNNTIAEGKIELEPLSDILLVLDKSKNKIKGVEGIDDEGNLKTLEPKKSSLADFMRVDKGDALSNFFSNFWRRLNDPISFRFFKTPAINMEEIAKKLQAAIDNPTPEGNKLLDALEVKYDKKQNIEEMAKQQTQQEQPEVNQEFKYNADHIDWDTAGIFGINKELLEKTGQLDKLLKGYKTDRVFTLSANIDGAPLKGDARLALRKSGDKIQFMMNFVRFKPNLEQSFFDHQFSPEDKENLLKTGNMGRVVNIKNYEDGKLTKALISLDRFTKEPVSYPQEWIKIKDEFGGVKLSEDQKQQLLEGKAVLIEGMKNQSSGDLFSKHIQFSADERKFVFVDDGLSQKQEHQQQKGIPDVYRGRELSEKDKKALESGKTIYMENLLTKDESRLYSGHLRYDKEAGELKFDYEKKQNKQEKKPSTKKQGL